MSDEFHAHEVIDRLHITQAMLEEMFYNHPFVTEHDELKSMIVDAQNSLAKAYQLAAELADD